MSKTHSSLLAYCEEHNSQLMFSTSTRVHMPTLWSCIERPSPVKHGPTGNAGLRYVGFMLAGVRPAGSQSIRPPPRAALARLRGQHLIRRALLGAQVWAKGVFNSPLPRASQTCPPHVWHGGGGRGVPHTLRRGEYLGALVFARPAQLSLVVAWRQKVQQHRMRPHSCLALAPLSPLKSLCPS